MVDVRPCLFRAALFAIKHCLSTFGVQNKPQSDVNDFHCFAERVLDVAELIRKHKALQKTILPWLQSAQPSEAWVCSCFAVSHHNTGMECGQNDNIKLNQSVVWMTLSC